MGEITDSVFLRPSRELAADEVNVFDAINLVIYAKVPLKSGLMGRSLIAGGIGGNDARGINVLPVQLLGTNWLQKYEQGIAKLHYPVNPAQFEPLLEQMVDDGETHIPYFFHEHHLMVDRSRRSALFSRYYSELADAVAKGEISVQASNSERARLLESHHWMTRKTLSTYLEQEGVTPWWENNGNVASHTRLERIMLSDDSDALKFPTQDHCDLNRLPSYVFGRMLLVKSQRPRGYGQVVKEEVTPKIADPDHATMVANVAKAQKATKCAGSSYANTSSVAESGSSQQPLSLARSLEPESTTPIDSSVPGVAHPGPNHVSEQDNPMPPQEGQFDSPTPTPPPPRMMTKVAVADFLGVSKGTIDNYRKRPDFPKAVSYGPNMIRWESDAISHWKNGKKTG